MPLKISSIYISLWAYSLLLFICCSFQKDLDFFWNRISHTSGLCHHWLNLTWHPCVRRPSFRPLTQSGLITVLQFTQYGCVYENCSKLFLGFLACFFFSVANKTCSFESWKKLQVSTNILTSIPFVNLYKWEMFLEHQISILEWFLKDHLTLN